MRRAVILLMTLALCLCACSTLAADAPQEIEVYLIDPCGKCMSANGLGCGECTVERTVSVRYNQLLEGFDYTLTLRNVYGDFSLMDERLERLAALGIEADVPWPTMFIGDAVFAADGSQDEQIEQFVRSGFQNYAGYAAVADAAKESSAHEPGNLVYLHSPYCRDCADILKWLEHAVPSGYTLQKYDLSTEEGARMQQQFCETYGLAPDELLVPFIAYGDHYFMGKDAIYVSLLSRIQEHPYLTTPTGTPNDTQ